MLRELRGMLRSLRFWLWKIKYFIKHPYRSITRYIENYIEKRKKPLGIGDDAYYIVKSYHNGRKNEHYRIYHSTIYLKDSRLCVGSGFDIKYLKLYRTEKQAQKALKRMWIPKDVWR